MAEIVVMPKMNLIMESGVLGRWYKTTGDMVTEGEPLCSVENEKETGDITAAAAGTLLRVWGVEGESYPVATPIALLVGIAKLLPLCCPAIIIDGCIYSLNILPLVLSSSSTA